MSASATGAATPPTVIQLDIGGMTCASCAARIEKKLNRMDGVTATVNYATERASVTFDDTVQTDDLIAQVEATGYTARLAHAKAERNVRKRGGEFGRRRPDEGTAATPADLGRAHRSGGCDGDDPRVAVRRVAMAVAHSGRSRRRVGGVAVPSRRHGSTCVTGQPRWTR